MTWPSPATDSSGTSTASRARATARAPRSVQGSPTTTTTPRGWSTRPSTPWPRPAPHSGAADPAVRLSCLVSLQAETEARTEEAVAAAYEAGHDWDDIAMRMAETTEDVLERFGPYIAWRAAGRPLPVRPQY